jgi:aldehyde:ferredoxin oxidoreductase
MDRVLFADLSSGDLQVEHLGPRIYEDYIGGYGVGAYVLYTRQRGGVDALGPENTLGFVTGPLTGTDAITGNRYCVVGKSPKTGTWGDANSGGFFGPALKASGFDATFFTGISPKPVYLLLENGKASLRSASHLWGLDSTETEDKLRAELGDDILIACIGPAGERRSLLACVMNDKGRAAGRSGLGAVMGSKKLKAIVARGDQEIPVADKERLQRVRKEGLAAMKDDGFYKVLRDYGTGGLTEGSVESGDCPIKNWGGTPEDFPTADRISDDDVIKVQLKRFGCWRCPIACGGHVKVESGPYASETHKPEYETLGVFGALCLNDNLESIVKANELCNRYGMDTISAGATVAFAIECFEEGVVTKEDTGGIELTWGNHEAIVAITEQIGKNEGFGAVLADGIQAAVDRIGEAAAPYAMHVQGEELPMHDPRLNPGLASSYKIDATPARHTQPSAWTFEGGDGAFAGISAFFPMPDRYVYSGKGEAHRVVSSFGHVLNAAGICLFGAYVTPYTALQESLSAAMGREYSFEDVLEIGERIAALRTAFNIREGLQPKSFEVPGRMIGKPPLNKGPIAGVTIDLDQQLHDYFVAMRWDPETGYPTRETLLRLGLDFVARDMYA